MFNYMFPQATVNNNQEKMENYVFGTMDINKTYFNHIADSLDGLSGRIFTTYFSRAKTLVESSVENAKEVVRTGHIKCQSCRKDSV